MQTQVTMTDQDRFDENQRKAVNLRKRFSDSGTLVLNLIGPSGAGKTSLVERTLAALPIDCWAAALISDRQTEADRQRMARFGFPIKQVAPNDRICHLDAEMIERSIDDLELNELDLLLIENVSNLVCSCRYNLGETAKIAVLSVAESVDEPLKYPSLFSTTELLILNKVDLLPAVHFSVEKAVENAHHIRPGLDVILTSCLSGQGLDEWMRWLNHRAAVLSSVGRSTPSMR